MKIGKVHSNEMLSTHLYLFILLQVIEPIITSDKVKVEWGAVGNGFHREMFFHVQGPEARNTSNFCLLNIKLKLSRGLYIDMYQMSNLEEFGGLEILSLDEIDVEKPAHHAKEHTLYIFGQMKVPRDPLGVTAGSALYTRMSFPVHLRYNKPSGVKEFADITLSKPQVLVQCNEFYREARIQFAPCHHSTQELCDWQVPQQTFNPEKIHFKVPVGKKADTVIVVIGTLLVSLGSCVFLIYIAISKSLSPTQLSKPRKT